MEANLCEPSVRDSRRRNFGESAENIFLLKFVSQENSGGREVQTPENQRKVLRRKKDSV